MSTSNTPSRTSSAAEKQKQPLVESNNHLSAAAAYEEDEPEAAAAASASVAHDDEPMPDEADAAVPVAEETPKERKQRVLLKRKLVIDSMTPFEREAHHLRLERRRDKRIQVRAEAAAASTDDEPAAKRTKRSTCTIVMQLEPGTRRTVNTFAALDKVRIGSIADTNTQAIALMQGDVAAVMDRMACVAHGHMWCSPKFYLNMFSYKP